MLFLLYNKTPSDSYNQKVFSLFYIIKQKRLKLWKILFPRYSSISPILISLSLSKSIITAIVFFARSMDLF